MFCKNFFPVARLGCGSIKGFFFLCVENVGFVEANAFMALGRMYILIFFCGVIQCIVLKPLCYCRCKFKILVTNPFPAFFTIDATIMAFQSLPTAPIDL